MKTELSHEPTHDAAAHRAIQHRGSLKRRLLAWFLVVALLPLTVVGAVSYYAAKTQLRDAAHDSLAAAADEKAAFIENWFRDQFIDLESQATNISNADFLRELIDAFHASDEPLDAFVTSYRWNVIVSERASDLKTFRKLYGYHDVFLIDADGNILFAVAGKSDLGTNLVDGPLANTRFAAAYRESRDTGRPAFADLEGYPPSNGAVAGFLTSVIVNDEGDKIGAFAVQIPHERIQHALDAGTNRDTQVRAYVVGYSPRREATTLRTGLGTNRLAPDAAPQPNSDAGQSADRLTRIVDTAQTRSWLAEHGPGATASATPNLHAFIYDGPHGERVLGTCRDVRIAGIDWGVVAEIPERVAFAPANRLGNMVISVVLTTGVLVVIIATIITGRIVRPIVRLSRVAERVASGDLDQRMHTSATDEIGALTVSFNAMVAHFSKLVGDLSTLRSALDEHAIVSITDINGDIVSVNEKFCRISGYSRDELVGQNHRMIKSDEHPPEFFRNLWKTVASGQVWSGELKNTAKDGSHYWLGATIVPFRNADGRIEQYVAIRTDITYVKEAEEQAQRLCLELKKTNLELEGQREETEAMNAELTALNYSLEAARAEAMQATKAKSDFLANMSHEIRTPMTAILGFSENLRDGGLSESEELDSIETIHKNGEYLLGLINDILDVSKIEAGKMKTEQFPCSVHSIVADVSALMVVRSNAKGLAFNTEFVGALPETIQSDPTRLKQILLNIIGNAIKFTKQGGVRLITRFVPGTDGDQDGVPQGPYIQFDVVDTGVGLTPVQANNLFQAFAQADSTVTRQFGGTGLGLTISKKFAEMLGGDITLVDSKAGCGTRFRTTIATGSLDGVRMIDPLSAAATTISNHPPGAGGTNKQLDCRILLAEDGLDNQRLIAFILKKAGADVTVAENGQVAVDQAIAATSEGNPFDVILMDMQMPVLDGYQATGTLREKGYDTPIIAITAHAMASDREKCIAAGCDDFATKPIDRKKLIALIQRYIGAAAMQTV